jgi:hypothetical protein
MGGLGKGLESLGQSLLQQQILKRQQEEMKRREDAQRAMQKLAFDRDMALKTFDLGLEEYQPAADQASQLGRAGAGMSAAAGPGMGAAGMGMGVAGDVLSAMAQSSQDRLRRGRTVDLPDFEGKSKRYFQPYERSAEGRRDKAKTDFLTAARQRGIPADQIAQLSVLFDSPEGMADEILKIVRPDSQRISRTQVMDLGTSSVVDILEDGTRRKVRDMTPAEIQRESTAPGQQPYNWGTVRDDATGEVLQVDPRSGQTRPISTPGGQPVREIPESIRKETAAIDILVDELDNLEEIIKRNGTTIVPGPALQEITTALNSAQIAYKTAAGLGVLNGPDLAIMEQALGDPTSAIAKLRGRGTSAQVLTALKGVREAQARRRAINERAFGVPARPAPPPTTTGGGSPGNPYGR